MTDTSDFTGERYLPELDSPELSYPHWHRYLFAEQLVRDKHVLDLACGEGYGSTLLAQSSKTVIGLDKDSKSIINALKKYLRDNLFFLVGSVTDIPIKGKDIFDIIVSFETIEHLDKELHRGLLDEVKRLLRKSGIFLISTPNRSFCGDSNLFKNEFHLKEYYDYEFKEFLGSYFRHVLLLGHNFYSGSYIWDPEKKTTEIIEYNLEFSEAGFRPAEEDKYILYMLAICSDREIQDFKPSILLDLSQRIFKLRVEDIIQITEKDRNISSFTSALNKKEKQIENLEGRIKKLEAVVLEQASKIAFFKKINKE